ncbi:MAG: beta-lactamase family protein [Candidatus Bipolaricaulota bacterium]|nr:MAG: beta-lactamase family protein [Candidatus Bipolaricaulota bacterium]
MGPLRAMADVIGEVDRVLRGRVGAALGPGLSVALTTRDGLLMSRAYGVANADSEEPVTGETLFQIGSITKQFTAAACLRLQESGRLDVNAPVTEYLPWFEVRSRFSTAITIHHLLTHTAGLITMMDCSPSSWWQTWALRDTELGFDPGSQFRYSNVGYNVLQCVVQTIAGASFDAALRELVFAPLGMEESYGEIRGDLFGRLAKGHRFSPYDDRPVPRPEKQTVVNWYELSEGCGSVVTTPTDLARFLRMLLRGGRSDDGSGFLREETFALMTKGHAVMEGFFEGTTQGYGVLIEQSESTNAHRRILGGGENLGFEATMYGDIEAGVGVILCGNSFDVPWRETRWILDALVAAAEDSPLQVWVVDAATDPTSIGDEAAQYAGEYSGEEGAFSIAAREGRLKLAFDGEGALLERIWGDNFLVPHPRFAHAMLTFGRGDEGRVIEAFQHGTWYRNERYRGPDAREYPSEWDAYAGHYRAFGVLVNSLRFFVRRDQFVCQSFGGYADTVLTPLGGGVFRVGGEDSPQRIAFDSVANGKALRCRASDGDFHRIE